MAAVPVVKKSRKAGRKPVKRDAQKVDTMTKLWKMLIGDFWARDKDGTKYYVNVTVQDGEKYIRMRVDMEGDKIEFLWEPGFAVRLAEAIFRAAFNAQVATVDEIERAWQVLRGQFRRGSASTTGKKPTAGQGAGDEEEDMEPDMPEFSFA